MKSIGTPSLVFIHFQGASGWVKLNKLAISVQKIEGQLCIPLTSPIYPLFRIKGSGITMPLFITSFTLYSSLIHLSLCSSSGFTGTLSHQAEKALAASDS